jgi:predicted nucleic-acid-binding Zn-ribbon protein
MTEFKCNRCGSYEYEKGEIRTTGSGISRFFNYQNQKFGAISCKSCGFTELYRQGSGGVGNLFDILSG